MLKVENLNKAYPAFALKDVSFSLEKGYITGFIGKNGAGKTTTLKSILNLVRPDSGTVTMFDKNMYENELELKQQIGFMLGGVDYYPKTPVKKVVDVYKRFYSKWDDKLYRELLKQFSIDENKKICELSAGMSTKIGIAMALSHDARLIILDEPTSGLDPVARDELLDLMRGIVEGGERSILFSTHITSDLDKCADYIVFIRNGRIIANDTKDDFINKHLLLRGKIQNISDGLKKRMISYKDNSFGFSGLILKEKLAADDNVQTEIPNLEDLMVYYDKEIVL